MTLEAVKWLAERGVTPLSDSSWMFPRNGGYENVIEELKVRDDYIKEFGFAIPCEDALDEILSSGGQVIEIGAGSGYWSLELAKRLRHKIPVFEQPTIQWPIATDAKTGRYFRFENGQRFHWSLHKEYVQVLELDAEKAVDIHFKPGRVLFTCWPDMDEDWPLRAVREYFIRGGTHVYYIGEGHGGCTGTDAFHEYLSKHFHLEKEIDIPQFWGIHDRLYCYRRD